MTGRVRLPAWAGGVLPGSGQGQERPAAGLPLPSMTCSRTPVAVAYSAASRANRPGPAPAAAMPAAGVLSVAFFSIDSILETLMTSTSRARAQAASACGCRKPVPAAQMSSERRWLVPVSGT